LAGGGLVTGKIKLPVAATATTGSLSELELRETEQIDNRSLPKMQSLIHRYKSSDTGTILFGIAADAASQVAPTSQVWKRIFTDFGLVGFVLLAVGFGITSAATFSRAPDRGWLVLFVLCFALSFYQRPIIWLPYNLLVFMSGLSLAGYRQGAAQRTPGEKNMGDRMGPLQANSDEAPA
jgi:hypothetical protein